MAHAEASGSVPFLTQLKAKIFYDKVNRERFYVYATPSRPRFQRLLVLFAVGIGIAVFNWLYLQHLINVQDKESGDIQLVLQQGSSPLGLSANSIQGSSSLGLSANSTQFALDLWSVSQLGPQLPRGIVLPLHNDVTAYGKSLILELRSLGVELPIEIPHCGDFPESHQAILTQNDSLVHIYNVCEEAEKATTSQGKLFCHDMAHCEELFRSFYIKPLAVVFSRFQEIMLLDADTIHFQSPMNLWETDKYRTTGTLFFRDRVAWESEYLDEPMPGHDGISKLHYFLASFNVAPFRALGSVLRPKARSTNASTEAGLAPSPVTLPFEPSDFLLTSHSWNRRAGHEVDSSVVLWNKARQPRATAILASFISLNQTERPPSYGDKEFFFMACELAETAYSFTDFGVGCVGFDLRTYHDRETDDPLFTLCGEILHFYPERTQEDGDDPAALQATPQFTNGDNVFTWDPTDRALYRTKARAADFYAGSFEKHGVDRFCPFNVTIVPLTQHEDARMRDRRALIEAVRSVL